jgi:two-component system CheB/CheR fusion protein
MAAKKKPGNKQPPPKANAPTPSPKQAARPAPPQRKVGKGRLPIVGIGASAGGLDAFRRFITKVPANSGLAFVLVPHLDPTHESLMAELLGRYTTMPVVEAGDGVRVEADHVYVIPPNRDMALHAGKLRLTQPAEPRGLRTSIDYFLRSLVDEQHELAIGIVLSGTGTHGTRGLTAIKAGGGLTMVQDPATAEYDQMPRSAVNAGVADFILPPEQMPDALVHYVRHFYVNGGPEAEAIEEATDDVKQILALLHARLKLDLHCYRKRMLRRRIERRMSLSHLNEMPEYLKLLRDNPDELRQLARDLLISVTGFFRDPEAFQVLSEKVIPALLQRKQNGSTIRVWVPACATGEEAYSLTMLLLEHMALAQKNYRLQVFASDIDEDALATARHGVYPESIAADVSAERLARFFTRADDHCFEVAKQLREPIVFAGQNILSDPPFSKLDLISCRNLLIYLESDAQRRLIPLLHFALNEEGILVLGPSETPGRHGDLFEPISKKLRIFRRSGHGRPEQVQFPSPLGREPRGLHGQPREPAPPRPNFAELTNLGLLEEFAAAAVLINRKGEILYFHGMTSRFLEMPPGEPTQDLLRLAREGLRPKLRAAIHKAIHEQQRITTGRVRVKFNGSAIWARATVKPIQPPRGPEGFLLVVLEEQREAANHADEPAAGADTLERQLESELQATRQDLQSTIEELESSNEELKSSNEEVMSMNEELQSANEELETSKEELQSLNEELTTVNNQLQEKISQLEQTNNDLANLLSSTDIATVFLDTSFRVKRFTPATTKLLSLLATDVGRPIETFARRFTDGDLLANCKRVLETLTPLEKEVKTDDDRLCLRRIMPYRTLDNKVEGVVLTFTDVTALKRATEHQRLLATMLTNTTDAVIVFDFAGRIRLFNHSAKQMYGYTEAEALTMNIKQLTPPPLRKEAAAMLERLRHDEAVPPWETQRLCKGDRILDVSLTQTALHDDFGKPVAVASTGRDITERKRAEQTIHELNASLEQRIEQRTAELERANHSLQLEIAERLRVEAALRESGERLAAVANQAAVEQLRIGQDLHDSVGQELTAVGLMADALAESYTDPAQPMADTAQKIVAGIRRALKQIRALSRGLIPVEVDAQGLMVALGDLAQCTNDMPDCYCTFTCAKPVLVEDNTAATHLYHIAQEAVTNALKHSGAKHIDIGLQSDDHRLTLTVRDDGTGVGQPDETKGVGLKIMRYRAGLLDGALTVGNADGGGTLVRCVLEQGESHGTEEDSEGGDEMRPRSDRR